jgi:3' terminal RNA ribose 2'-O-methyltransferase Hen1
MLLSITTTHKPASDLGYLLHKHPDRFQSIDLSIGQAHIFYPKVSEDKATMALLLDIDPIEMVRKSRSGKDFALGQYVNDRPYVASSFLSVAIAKAFSTAMNGKCDKRPDLVDLPLPFEVSIPTLPAPRGGDILIKKLFEPLGYKVELQRLLLDEKFSNWGYSKYFSVKLSQIITTKELLSHLYVLIPALDNDKHYYVSQNEIEKLLKKGKGWLEEHPEKEQITRRYLLNLGSLSRQALAQLSDGDDNISNEPDEGSEEAKNQETLHKKRLKLVLEQLKATGAESVIDLGCGEGKLLRMLLKEKQFKKITGMDISYSELSKAKDKLHWEEMAPRQKERINLFQGALTYKDQRLEGFDAAAVVEVIEHMDEGRLQAFERVLFEFAKPNTVVLTTPNAEYNTIFENLSAGTMRHSDHRFEWTREEFESWAKNVAEKYNYNIEFLPVGAVEDNVGAPSQMGVFTYGD